MKHSLSSIVRLRLLRTGRAGRAVKREEGVGDDLTRLAAGDEQAGAVIRHPLRPARLDHADAGVEVAVAAVVAADDAAPGQPPDVQIERIGGADVGEALR